MLKIINDKKLKTLEKFKEEYLFLNSAKTLEIDYMNVIIALLLQLGGQAIIEKSDLLNRKYIVEQIENHEIGKIRLRIVEKE
jgi:hypothetical protein